MVTGAATIPVGWNRKENHDRLEKEMQENIAKRGRGQGAQRDHVLRQPRGHVATKKARTTASPA